MKANNFHKNHTVTYYEVADANWGMYNSGHFKTIKEAKECIQKEYKQHTNEYWKNRKQIIIKKTIIIEIVSKPI